MASSWRYGKRSKYRAKVSQDPQDFYRLDPKKSPAENAYDVYTELCCRDTRDTKHLFLLNGLATLCQQQYTQQHQQRHQQQQQQQQQHKQLPPHQSQQQQKYQHSQLLQHQHQQQQQQFGKSNLGFTTEELLYCLSASLIHTFTQVRAAALRTIRYALHTPRDIKVFNSLQLHHLLVRSIDVVLRNDDERVQALKLIRKMLAISADDISPAVVRCLVSLADSGIEDGDNMLRACLATLCEFAVLNPTLLIVCGGVTSITRNVLECHNPRIAESLCGVLLYLLESPQTRNISGVRLDCLAAPYCDFTYRLGIMDKIKDARELRYTSCRLALLSVLRSWTGTIEFCDPSKPSGLKAIVDALYLNQIEVRKAILDLLYELLGLQQPAWTDDYSVALQAVDPSDFQDAWLLSNGFVASEGRSILPSLASRAPNVCEQHLALLLYCFLETGLLNALVEVIVAPDTHVSVRATVLIGKIIHLMHTHLPPDICSTSPALPTLLTHATQGNQRAMAAISALCSYQQMLRNRPAACSLFLDSIIQGGTLIQTRLFRRDINALEPTAPQPNATAAGGSTLDRPRLDSASSSEESNSQTSSSRRSSFRLKRKLLPFFENLRVNRLIKDSNVLSLPDAGAWDWEVVTTILRSNLIRKLDDSSNKFMKRLILYFKPSSNRFSHQDLVLIGSALPAYVMAGLDLIDWLLASPELESMRLLTDLFSDISQHLLAVTTSNRAHDCLFSPQHMNNTMCQQYFLYIGRMCRVQKGISILTNTATFQHLISLVRNTEHVCYVKLIVSGLDYTLDSVTRKVLEKALTASKTRSGRLYATQFLTVLLRARIPNFEVWGIPLIIRQTKDPDRSVVLAAMDVLEEASHEKYYLEEIVCLWPNLKPLGDVGRLLMARYYSLSRGLNHQKARIKEEIEYWKHGYNMRYVLLVEADTHSSLTLHKRNEDGYYSRRNCLTRPNIVPPNISPHLYGQMAQMSQGMTALRKYADLPHLVDVISRGKCTDEVECLELKAAVWAVGHVSTHSNGIEYFTETNTRIYEKIVFLATKCDVYSIRATSFNVLGLIAGTNAGANVLFKLNWLSVRHDRNSVWPVHQSEDWMSSSYTPARHYCEEMPPYNYTGIEDQNDGFYSTGSYWNLLLRSGSSGQRDGASAARSDQQEGVGVAGTEAAATSGLSTTSVDNSRSTVDGMLVTAAAKSKTLPESTYSLRHAKHQRSLSESKTTDVISLIGGPGAGGVLVGGAGTSGSLLYHQNRIRYNSCTDSNTSGVSSCESVTGLRGTTTAAGEFQQVPLSPIPSMSNLLDIAPQAGLLRRTSLLGTSYLQHALSPVDIKGYAQLRSLRRHCRPVLSESATELYDIIDRKDLFSYTSFRPRKSSWGESQRRVKVRSLDRQSSLRMFTHLDFEELQVPLPKLAPPKFLSQNDSKGPCYAGICLPKNLLDLFPTRNFSRTYVSRDIQDQDLMDINLLTAKQEYLNDSLNNEDDGSSIISSLSDVSSVSKRSKWLGTKHGRGNCLHCSRSRRNRQHLHQLDSESNLFSTTTSALLASSSASSAAAAAARRSSRSNQSSSIQLSDISFNSPESILSEESMPDRVTANVLYHVQRLANPVSAKQSRMALLEARQKHPNSFQDICLYSEVCKSLGRCSYRMAARRFLQELFLDLNFESFYAEPVDILSKKSKDLSLMAAAGESHTSTKSLEKRLAAVELGGGSMQEVTSNFNASATHAGSSHKSHLKHIQPALASVYEASCENLLIEPESPAVATPKLSFVETPLCEKQATKQTEAAAAAATAEPKLIPATATTTATALVAAAAVPAAATATANSSSCSSSNTGSTTPRFIVHQETSFQNVLHIGSDVDYDEDEAEADADADADDEAAADVELEIGLRVHGIDEVDNTTAARRNVPLVNHNSINTVSSSSSSQQNITPSSNLSDQNSEHSNRSSICTISTEATEGVVAPIENENTKYTRGRFYTLELDLSCTKNKFPITEKRRSTAATKEWLTTPTTITTQVDSPLFFSACNPNHNNSYSSSSNSSSSHKSISDCNSNSNININSNSNISESSRERPLSLNALNVTSHSQPLTASNQHQLSIKTSNCAESGAQEPTAKVPSSDPSAPHLLTATPCVAITKSLAASLAKPIGSLYCEKRLQSSKSEVVLTNAAATTTTTACSRTLPVMDVIPLSKLSSLPVVVVEPPLPVTTTTTTMKLAEASKT